jgi:hypothetical protein
MTFSASVGLLAQQQTNPGLLTSDLGPAFPVIWTISMGFLLGALIVGLIYCVAALSSRKAGLLLEELIFDGLLKPVFWFTLFPSAIALLLLYFAPVREVFRQVSVFLSAMFVPSRWSSLWKDAPDAIVMAWAAGFVVVMFLIGLLLRLALPKVVAVAYKRAWPSRCSGCALAAGRSCC